MNLYFFARNTKREYYDVPANSEAEARASLSDENDDPIRFYSGRRFNDEDDSPFELIDIEYDDEDEPEVPLDTLTGAK